MAAVDAKPSMAVAPRVLFGSAAFLLGQAVSTVIFALLALAIAPMRFERRYAVITSWTRFNLWWLRLTCGLHQEVRGLENIPGTPGVILCKHESAWETLALQTVFYPQSWVLKRELLRIPFFGWGLRMLRPIAIDRSAGREAVKQLIAEGRERLGEGSWIVVFPEGTRVAPGESRPFQKGGSILAKRAGATITPVAHNAGDFWPRRSFLKFPGTIQMVIGPPIDTRGMNTEEINTRAKEWIETEVAALRNHSHDPQP